jgi:hypothetical protein
LDLISKLWTGLLEGRDGVIVSRKDEVSVMLSAFLSPLHTLAISGPARIPPIRGYSLPLTWPGPHHSFNTWTPSLALIDITVPVNTILKTPCPLPRAKTALTQLGKSP